MRETDERSGPYSRWLDRVEKKMGRRFRYALKDALRLSSMIIAWGMAGFEAVGALMLLLTAMMEDKWWLILYLIPLAAVAFVTILVLNLIGD